MQMMRFAKTICHITCGFALCATLFFAGGCATIISYYTQSLFDDLAISFMKQRDVVLAEQGIPAYLLIIDGMIEHSPNNKNLLLTGSKAYSAYTAAFVGDKNPTRNKILAEKAREYAFRAFSIHNKKFGKVKDKSYSEFISFLPHLRKKDVPYLYYVATSWAGWIEANSESWDSVADLPKVQSLIKRTIELDESYNYGASHTFMGVLLSIRPPSIGGKPEKARKHFERAIELSRGNFLPTYVMYAKFYAKPLYKEELFTNLLNKVLNAQADKVPELTLVNTLAQRQARELMEDTQKEGYFE